VPFNFAPIETSKTIRRQVSDWHLATGTNGLSLRPVLQAPRKRMHARARPAATRMI
jgi:hypothetical protein